MRDNRAAACCPLETVSTGHFESSQAASRTAECHYVAKDNPCPRMDLSSPLLSSPLLYSTPLYHGPVVGPFHVEFVSRFIPGERPNQSSRKREHAVSIMRSVTPLSTVANRVSSNTSRVPTSLSLSAPHGQIRIVAPITRGLRIKFKWKIHLLTIRVEDFNRN